MDVKNLIMGVIALSLGAVIIAGALLPAVASVADDQHEYYNNSAGQYSSIANDTVTLTLTYDESNNEIYTVNGANVPLVDNYTDLILSTNVALISVGTDTGAIRNALAYYDGTSNRIENITSATVTLSPNNVAIEWVKNDTTDSVTLAIDWGFYATETGDYRTAYMPWDIYINNIDQVYGASWLVQYSKFFSFAGDKVICDGVEYDANVTMTPVNGVVDVFTISQRSYSQGYNFVVNFIGTDYTVGPYSVIVPAEIEGDKTGYSDVIVSLFNVLPIVVIAGLVMAGIYVFISRK